MNLNPKIVDSIKTENNKVYDNNVVNKTTFIHNLLAN